MSDERFDRIEASLSRLTILHEDTRDHVKRIAEGLVATNERLDLGFAELRDELREVKGTMNMFVREQSKINREFRDRFSNHGDRLQSLERRRRGR